MAKPRTRRQNNARRDIAHIAGELAALQTMSVGELCEKYREVFGEPTRSRNKQYLYKKIAWRIQEIAEGGLSERAFTQIDTLATGLPRSWRRRLQPADTTPVSAGEPSTPQAAPRKKRDPRMPSAGTVLERDYRGTVHTVTVLEAGFEYRGTRYRSLSKVAREITGTQWNGLLFFGLTHRTRKRAAEETGA